VMSQKFGTSTRTELRAQLGALGFAFE